MTRGVPLAAALGLALTLAATAQTLPNAAAITTRFDVPGHDDGFIPQGMTFHGGDLWLSGYRWPLPGRQACRLYRLDTQGHVTGARDLPTSCGHAGGLAAAGGRFFVADTRRLIEVDPARVFDTSADPIRRVWPLGKPVDGSFLTARGADLWIGTYATSGAPKLWRVPLAAIDALPDGASISERQATAATPAPLKSQGADFAPGGALWLSQSGQTFGSLTLLDAATGTVLKKVTAPSGIEGIAFDGSGALWAVSETGSRRWAKAPRPFPYVYRIDPNQ